MGNTTNEKIEAIKLYHSRALSLLEINSKKQDNLLKQYIVCLALFFAGLGFLLSTTGPFALTQKNVMDQELDSKLNSIKKELNFIKQKIEEIHRKLTPPPKTNTPFPTQKDDSKSRMSYKGEPLTEDKTAELKESKNPLETIKFHTKKIYLAFIGLFILMASCKFNKLNKSLSETIKNQLSTIDKIEKIESQYLENLNIIAYNYDEYSKYSKTLTCAFCLGKLIGALFIVIAIFWWFND